MVSKSRIDKSGLALSRNIYKDDLEYIELEDVFDEYRKSHLLPLTETTLELQQWLTESGIQYYIAQRLKRKPQIIRKLNRLSVRLTQLQDIGGARIVVEDNAAVGKLRQYLTDKIQKQDKATLIRVTDYRDFGRDDTGYRALHMIFSRNKYNIELQIRSRIQHHWAESIERTSVIYGFHLKEKEGDPNIINYFKLLSNTFYEIEAGRQPSVQQRLELDRLKTLSEHLITTSDKHKVFDSYVDEDIVRTLISKESNNKSSFNNWILIFDWNSGSFVSWDIVSRQPDEAIKAYVENEKNYPAELGYEVVLIGSTNIATVRQTHSHYFGIEAFNGKLENLDQSIIGFSRQMDIDTGARQILYCLHKRNAWGYKAILPETLKNHFCRHVMTFASSLETLIKKELVLRVTSNGAVALNVGKKNQISNYLQVYLKRQNSAQPRLACQVSANTSGYS